MRFEWDPEKDALNRRKHGLALEEGISALDDPRGISWIDNRFDYGEERILTLGLNKHRLLFVVSTERDETLTRIISVRKAEDDEIEKYDFT